MRLDMYFSRKVTKSGRNIGRSKFLMKAETAKTNKLGLVGNNK